MSWQDEDKPAKVGINLDTLEREGDAGPFVTVLGGKRYELIDAADLDFRVLLDIQRSMMTGEVEKAFEALVHEDDREAFFAHRMPMWKLEKLFNAYSKHFGMPLGPDGPGKYAASSPS